MTARPTVAKATIEHVATNRPTNGHADAVFVQRLEIERITVALHLRGTSSLICHRWDEKAKGDMLAKQQKRATKGKEPKDPEAQYRASLYTHPSGGYGFPAIAFKAAAVRAGTYCDLKMTFLRGAFHVVGELVPLVGAPTMREDIVRIGMGVADLRYRAEFAQWETDLQLEYNKRAITLEQIVNLFNIAGFAVGIGEWRPERDGQHGRFEVID